MSLQSIEIEPTRQQQAAVDRSKPLRVTGRLKRAIDLMVWDGKRDNEAACEAKITVNAIRVALRQGHVRAYYRAQLEVLRQRESARNVHVLMEVRDDKANKIARVQAVRALEHMSEDGEAPRAGMAQLAGFVIVIRESATQQAPMLDVTPASSE